MPSMLNQLESSLGLSVTEDRQVKFGCLLATTHYLKFVPLQTLTTVVEELDRTLFESFTKPKAAKAMDILRGGILDSKMDWYETPQPTGKLTTRHRQHLSSPQIYGHICTRY